MKKLFNILVTIVVTVFLLVVGLLLISSFDIPGLPLDARAVLTGSMEPVIPTGSVVFIWPQSDYVVGDIITFKRAESRLEMPITHRIVEVETVDGQTRYRTKGDANDGADAEPVLQGEVYGQVVAHLPFVGRLLDMAKTPWGFAALVIVPAFLVIIDEISKIVGYLRGGKKKEEIVDHKEEDKN